MVRTVASLFVVSLLATMSASAQTGDGSLRGYIKDEQGGVLPGVTVTARSSALLTPVVAITASDGYYRLLSLPPGTYTITAELTGFATYRREGILMRAGSIFTVDIVMRIGTLEETITVSGEPPMIDTGKPTSALTIQGELLRAAPVSSRRVWSDMLDMAPGVNSRNVCSGDRVRAIYFHGADIYSNVVQLEGGMTASYSDAGLYNFTMGGDTIADAEIKLGGVDAASPLGVGLVVNIVTPRGGNQRSGSASYQFQPLKWNADNTKSGAHPGGLPNFEVVRQWDLSLGGPVVKNKAWFFSTYRYSDITNGISRTATDLTFLRAFRPGFQPFDSSSRSHQPFVKVTTQLSTKHELSTFYQYDRRRTVGGRERDTDQVTLSAAGGSLVTAKLNSVWTNRLASQVSASWNNKSGSDEETFRRQLELGVGPQVLVHQNTFLSAGLPTGSGRLVTMNNVQSVSLQPASMLVLRGDLTYFREGWGGSHEFKTGIWAAPRLHYDITTRYVNDGFVLEEARQIDPNNPAAGLIPFHRQYRTPIDAKTTAARDRDVGVYVQDAWKPHPRVTANVGVRADFISRHDAIFDVDRMKSTEVGPRLGVAYQVTEDARNVFRASYGRLHEQVNGRDVVTTFASGLPRGAAIRDLYDANGDGVFETEVLTPAATAALSGLEFDPTLHQPFVDELVVGFAKQFRGQISLNVSGTRRTFQDGYALVDINGIYPEGPYQRFGGFGKVDANRGLVYQQRNRSWSDVAMTFVEAVLAKNMSNKFQMVLSVSRQWQHLEGTWNPTDPARFIQPDAFSDNRQLTFYYRGNAEQNSLNGGGSEAGVAYRPYSIRAAGQYFAPLGIKIAGSYVIQAGGWVGTVLTRLSAADPRFGPSTIRLANGTTQPNPLSTTIRFAYSTQSEGQTRNEDVRFLQLLVGREFRIGRQRIDGTLGMFNIFNTGAHSQWNSGANQLYSANYLTVFNRHPPRQFQLTFTYRF